MALSAAKIRHNTTLGACIAPNGRQLYSQVTIAKIYACVKETKKL
jgi:hypothetical protein